MASSPYALLELEMLTPVAVGLLCLIAAAAAQVATFDLDGEWTASNDTSSFKATVPGQIHMDLFNNGLIGMPSLHSIPCCCCIALAVLPLCTHTCGRRSCCRGSILPLQRLELPVDRQRKLDLHAHVHSTEPSACLAQRMCCAAVMHCMHWCMDWCADCLRACCGVLQIMLVAEGLDTVATVTINNVLVLSADDMFRTWRVDVAGVLNDVRPFV